MEMPHDNPCKNMSRSLAAFDQNNTLVMVAELSRKSWLVAGLIPGVERQPKKKMEPDAEDLLRLLGRWRDEAVKGGRPRSGPRRLLARGTVRSADIDATGGLASKPKRPGDQPRPALNAGTSQSMNTRTRGESWRLRG